MIDVDIGIDFDIDIVLDFDVAIDRGPVGASRPW